MDEQRKQFHDLETTPGKDALKIFEMTMEGLKQCINLVDSGGRV